MCVRCGELEAEVEYLKAELGAAIEETEQAALRRAWGLRPNEAWLVLYLYRNHGRLVNYWRIVEAMPSPLGNEDRGKNNVNVMVSRIRSKTAPRAIEVVRGSGVMLGDWLTERIPGLIAA